jgi:hypothetical protein
MSSTLNCTTKTTTGVNDSENCAHQLGRLLAGRDMHINLIPWNPVLAGDGIIFSAPAPGSVDAFRSAVRAYGLSVTVRQEKGQDISGACGQLVIDTSQLAAQGRALQGLPGRARSCGGANGSDGGVKDIEELAAAVE